MDKLSWKNFLTLCLASPDVKEFNALLEFFLTAEEKKNLALRYLIIKELLQEEKTQRQIAKDLNVSIAKITRGSNELKRMNPKLLAYLKNHFRLLP